MSVTRSVLLALVLAWGPIAQQAQSQPGNAAQQVRDMIRQLAAGDRTEVFLELHPSSVPLVFGPGFDPQFPASAGRSPAGSQPFGSPQTTLVGRITQAGEKDFRFLPRSGGLELTLYYSDVRSAETAPVYRFQPRKPLHPVAKVTETIVMFPVRLIHIFLLGGLCEVR